MLTLNGEKPGGGMNDQDFERDYTCNICLSPARICPGHCMDCGAYLDVFDGCPNNCELKETEDD